MEIDDEHFPNKGIQDNIKQQKNIGGNLHDRIHTQRDEEDAGI